MAPAQKPKGVARKSTWQPPPEGEGFTVKTLEALLRHWVEFRELYKLHGIEEITLEDGTVVNVHDVLQGVDTLPPKQKQALYLSVVSGLTDEETANVMGINATSPIGNYRILALRKLMRFWENGVGG